MSSGICVECVDDDHLRVALSEHFEPLVCSRCGASSNQSVTVENLAAVIEPVLREHFTLGEEEKRYGDADDDRGWWIQKGDTLQNIVEQVTGQYFEFHEELIDAVIDLDYHSAKDGDGLWDRTSNYVARNMRPYELHDEWNRVVEDLKQNRRFFSSAALRLFNRLFAEVDTLFAWGTDGRLPVVVTVAARTIIHRARICSSLATMKEVVGDALKGVGPPPSELARAGRMNPEGVVVLYAAFDGDTARAELRPAIGNDIATIQLSSTRPLKVLDFERLEKVTGPRELSFFQSDFEQQVNRSSFLRRLHSLISQPVTPGKESDYLISQSMAEYLAFVHPDRFDGIKFSSAQKAEGLNVVLFSHCADASAPVEERFGVDYVAGSLQFSRTFAVEYCHHNVDYLEREDGELVIYVDDNSYPDDDSY